jgi:hypothetical protein
MSGHRARDMVGSARVLDAGDDALGDAKAVLDLAQSQNPTIRKQPAAVEFDHDILARGTGRGSIGSFMAGGVFLKVALF